MQRVISALIYFNYLAITAGVPVRDTYTTDIVCGAGLHQTQAAGHSMQRW